MYLWVPMCMHMHYLCAGTLRKQRWQWTPWYFGVDGNEPCNITGIEPRPSGRAIKYFRPPSHISSSILTHSKNKVIIEHDGWHKYIQVGLQVKITWIWLKKKLQQVRDQAFLSQRIPSWQQGLYIFDLFLSGLGNQENMDNSVMPSLFKDLC